MNISTNVEVVQLDVRVWTGTRKITEGDLGLKAGTLPPDKLATLGSLRVVEKDAISTFATIKKSAQRCCRLYGPRFLNGYAVPKSRVAELIANLDEMATKYETARTTLLNSYRDSVQELADTYPKWAELIIKKAPSSATVGAALAFGYTVFTIGEPASDKAQESLNAACDGISETLLKEIAQDATEIWETGFNGRAFATSRTVRPVRELADKIRGLSFLDRTVRVISERFEEVVNAMPKEGRIIGADLTSLSGLVLLAKSEADMRKFAQASTTVASEEAVEAAPASNDPEPPQAVQAPKATVRQVARAISSQAFV